MLLIDLLAVSLAVWQTGEIWRHGRILSGLRDQIDWLGGPIADLLLCPFCLSVWLGWLFCLLLVLRGQLTAAEPYIIVFVYGLAASRLANLANDLFHAYCRTPRVNVVEENVDVEDGREKE